MVVTITGAKNNCANGKIESKQWILDPAGENNQGTDGRQNRADQTSEEAFDFFLFP